MISQKTLENCVLCVSWVIVNDSFMHEFGEKEIEYPELKSWSLIAFFDNLEYDVTRALSPAFKNHYEEMAIELMTKEFSAGT